MSRTFQKSTLPVYVGLALASLTPGPARAADDPGAPPRKLAPVEVSADAPQAEPEGTAATGYRVRTASLGPLGNRPLEELPFAVSVTSREFMENLHANRPTEALRYNPAVNPEMGSNRNGDYFAIRGFINSSNQAIDGLRATVASGGWLEDKERVEVLNGAAAFLYGLASPAGMVNYVLKRPTETPFHTLTVGDYGGAQGFAHLDLGGPLDGEGRFAYRLNALGVGNGETGVDRESQPRSLLSAAVDWQVSADTVVSLDAARYHARVESLQAYFFVSNLSQAPSAPNAATNYSAPYSVAEQDDQTQGVQVKSRINDQLTLRANVRHGLMDQRYSGVRDRFVNNDGRYTQEMYYYRAPNVTHEDRGSVFADLQFNTGPLAHRLSAGVVGNWVRVDSAGTSTYNFPTSTVFSLSSPGLQANPNVNTGNPVYTTGRTQQISVILADEVRLSDAWSVLAGANRSRLNDRSYSGSNGALTSAYERQAVTPSFALMFKPQAGLMFYGSYNEALEQGATAPSTAKNAGEVLAPYLSTQYEVGSKLTLGQVDLKTALFRIERDSAYTDPSTQLYKADGRQVHEGVEFSFTGKLSPHLTLLGGASLLNARLTRTAGGSLDGKHPQAVPDKLLRLYGEYSLPEVPGLVLSAGLSHTGAMWADDPNTLKLPAVTTGDLGVRYTTTLGGYTTIYRASVSNVTNENYWTSKGGSMIYLGSPRTLGASATVAF